MSRSPGQMLLATSPSGDARLGSSPSGQSTTCEFAVHVDVHAVRADCVNVRTQAQGFVVAMLSSSNASSPSHLPPLGHGIKRRSTDTASLDEYYFSSLAGVGASSSTSSLAMSPDNSNGLLSFGTSPTPSIVDLSRGPSSQGHIRGLGQGQGQGQGSRSHASLRDLINQEGESMSLSTSPTDHLSTLPRPPFSHQVSSDSQGPVDPGPSNRRIHVVSYPSDPSVPRINPQRQDSSATDDDRSPGGYSQSSASHYSSSELSSDNESFGFDVDGGALRGLLGPEAEREWGRSGSRIEVRESVDSSITVMDNHTTPMPTDNMDRFELHPPHFSYPDPHQSRGQNLSPRYQTQTSPTSPKNDRTPTIGGPVISSGRLAFVAPPDTSKRSLSALQSEMQASSSRERMDVVVNDAAPKSAPPTQSDFGQIKEGDEDGEDTIKGRNRMTLPLSASSAFFAEQVVTPDKEAPRRDSLSVKDTNASPNKSPQPPPRSTLRPQ